LCVTLVLTYVKQFGLMVSDTNHVLSDHDTIPAFNGAFDIVTGWFVNWLWSYENKLLSSTVAHLVHTILQAAIANCLALQDLPCTIGIHEIKKSNVAIEWIPVLLCIWDVHNTETNSYMFPVFFLKS